MGLSSQIIDLIRLNIMENPGQVGAVRKVSVMEDKALVADMRILVDMIHTLGVEG